MKYIIFFLLLLSTGATISQTNLKSITTDKIVGISCNNNVNDKLVGRSHRSPSECEILFDHQVRQVFNNAFQNVFFRKENSDWIINNGPKMDPIEGVGRNTETDLFRLGNTNNGDLNYELQLNPSSASAQEWSRKFYEAMEGIKKDGAKMPGFMKLNYEMQNATNILLYTSINNLSTSISIFKGGHELIKIPGTNYAFRGSEVAALSGGGRENSRDACLIVLGKWKQPVVEKSEDGSEYIRLESLSNKSGSRLTVQNVVIRIECNKQLADLLIREIDFNKLQSMLSQ